MLASLVILALLSSHATQGSSAVPSKSGSAPAQIANDPYTPLRQLNGKWDVAMPAPDKAAAPTHLENRCGQVGEFYACNQIVNGKNTALVIFLPSHALPNGGYSYRNQALRTEGDNSGAWSNMEITGDRWVYSSESTENGKKTHWQTVNIFSGSDKIHFDVQRSDDGVKWTTTMSGDEARAK
jgi:hypothetical protein